MVWHDHGNEGSQPVMWLDGLDIPLTTSLNCMFMEGFSGETQPANAPLQRSEKLYGRGMFPSESLAPPALPYSPVWAYRWTEAREALDVLARDSAPDPFDGHILRYVNPANGGEVLPTMGCRLQLLRKGTHTAPHRHTPSVVYHVAEGSGYSVIDGARFDWCKGDTFAVPIWRWHEHVAENEDAVLFSVTDEPVLAPLGLVRSEAYPDNKGFQKVR
jgi:gentisate 1,2-dioxygenase